LGGQGGACLHERHEEGRTSTTAVGRRLGHVGAAGKCYEGSCAQDCKAQEEIRGKEHEAKDESEKIGIDMIIKSPPDGDELDSPSLLMSDINDLELTLQELLEKLQRVERYVRQIQEGTIEGDESLGWLIGEALSSVPTISPSKFEKMLSNRLQDLLMIVYLGKLSRAQLTIADKINQVLHTIQGPQ